MKKSKEHRLPEKILVAAMIGLGVGGSHQLYRHVNISNRIEPLIEELRQSGPRSEYYMPQSLLQHDRRRLLLEAIGAGSRSLRSGRDITDELCEMRYGYIVSIFDRNHIAFTTDTIDLQSPSLVRTSGGVVENQPTQFWIDVQMWNRDVAPTERDEDLCLVQKVTRRAELVREIKKLQNVHEMANGLSLALGILAGVIYLALTTQAKIREKIIEIQKEEPGISSAKRLKRLVREMITERKEPTVATKPVFCEAKIPPTPKRAVVDKEAERLARLEKVRETLIGVIGLENTEILTTTLTGKFSIKIIDQVVSGDYKGLISLINRNAKPLKDNKLNCQEVITFLNGETVEGPESEAAPKQVDEKIDHPLMKEKARGWRRADFHQMLNKYGFDTSEMNGNGHHYVKDKKTGEQIRESDGRFVLVPGLASSTEVTPGTARSIMKQCAKYLIEKRSKQIIDRNDYAAQ